MDPLSDVLSLLKPKNHMSAGFDVKGDWAIQFPDPRRSIKCGSVIRGRCWLAVEDQEPVLLEEGDSFLLAGGRPFLMASDMSVPAVPAMEVFSPARRGGVVTVNGGGDFLLVSSRFGLAGDHAHILLSMLPPVVHIRRQEDSGVLRWSVERMMQELRAAQPGGFLVTQHLAHMILIEALRLHMNKGAEDGVGWLFALTDKRLGAAIAAMHADPARRWTLQSLAALAGMSRTVFAERFKQAAGKSPMDYLAHWRMRLAADRLVHSGASVALIALGLGYESESAFGVAFKRVMGCAPRQYARNFADRPDVESSEGPASGDAYRSSIAAE
ncbi:AraC family transcriptional regulator [Rhizobium sp. PAMB 3174]